jgi:flagellar motor switch protein FliN/FliY
MTPLEQIGPVADIPVRVEVELDRQVMRIGEILQLEAGSILRMSRSAGDNIDILVEGALVGYGEIVILEDSMGVRITDFNEDA